MRGDVGLLQFRQFTEHFFMSLRDVLRDVDKDLDEQITGPPATRIGHALFAQAENLTNLRPGWYRQLGA